MLDRLKEVKDKQEQATSARKKGDALRKTGREEKAVAEYGFGVAVLAEQLKRVEEEERQLREAASPLSAELEPWLDELVEVYGIQGGLLQRLGQLKEALDSYMKGAFLEERFALPNTYNRLNAVKCSLLAGEKRLRDVEPQLQELAQHIDDSLRRDSSLGDSGWVWADLGDCQALLGDPEKAQKNYSTFIAKAEIKSPERTLDVLKGIASKLEQWQDPDAARLQAAIEALQRGLANR